MWLQSDSSPKNLNSAITSSSSCHSKSVWLLQNTKQYILKNVARTMKVNGVQDNTEPHWLSSYRQKKWHKVVGSKNILHPLVFVCFHSRPFQIVTLFPLTLMVANSIVKIYASLLLWKIHGHLEDGNGPVDGSDAWHINTRLRPHTNVLDRLSAHCCSAEVERERERKNGYCIPVGYKYFRLPLYNATPSSRCVV